MPQIHTMCRKIIKQLTKLGLQTASNMLPGLSEEAIREATLNLPFDLPQSVIDLYMWSEGLGPRAGVGNEFFPGFGMDSLSEMVVMYRELASATDFPRFRAGDIQWFPIFRDGGTDFYGIRCSDSPADDDGEIVYDSNEGPHRDGITPPLIYFNSLEAMLRTLLRCYETGVYYMDDGRLTVGIATYFKSGRLKSQLKNVDISAFKEVARQFNPGVAEWE